MNQIHLLLSIHNTHVLLRHESDTLLSIDMNEIHVLPSIHNVHDLLRHESHTVYT